MKPLQIFFILCTTFLFISCEDILDSLSDPGNNPVYVVNTIGDTPDINPTDSVCEDANGNCSFRAAIQQVNTHQKWTHTIQLGTGIHILDSPLVINGGLTVNIEGTGMNNTVIEANGAITKSPTLRIKTEDRVSVINIKKLSIIGGNADFGGNGAPQPSGGGLLMSGEKLLVNMEKVTIRNNRALVNGGGIANLNGRLNLKHCNIQDNNCINRKGGGIYNQGRLTIEGSAIVKNSTGRAGEISARSVKVAGISNSPEGVGIITNSTISDNFDISFRGEFTNGINIYNSNHLLLKSSTIVRNTEYAGFARIQTNGDSLKIMNTVVVGNYFEGDNFYTLGGNFIDRLYSDVLLKGNSSWMDQVGTESTLEAKLSDLTFENNTWFHLPFSDSPLIDKGTGIVPGINHPDACLDIDQRGLPRTGVSDIGAIEKQ